MRDVVSTTGAELDHIVYDSFGNIVTETNATNGDRFKFAGMELDSAIVQYYDRARAYDSLTGRFSSQDPTGFSAGDPKLFRYVLNYPTDSVDPTGFAGVYRHLTPQEQRYSTYLFNVCYPALKDSPELQARVAEVLSQVKLWDANTISGLKAADPRNIIAQAILSYNPKVAAVTPGVDQFYRNFPLNNDSNTIDLVGHELTHSFHANLSGSDGIALVNYTANGVGNIVTIRDPSRKNFTEMIAYSFQSTIQTFPNVWEAFKSGTEQQLPPNTGLKIQGVFLNQLGQQYAKY